MMLVFSRLRYFLYYQRWWPFYNSCNENVSIAIFMYVNCNRNGGMALIIRETTILDAGYYQCHGKNMYGWASSTPVLVIVQGTPFHQW